MGKPACDRRRLRTTFYYVATSFVLAVVTHTLPAFFLAQPLPEPSPLIPFLRTLSLTDGPQSFALHLGDDRCLFVASLASQLRIRSQMPLADA